MKKVRNFVKREMVMFISLVLAGGSMFLVKPDVGYAEYIDFRTLGILLGLMLVVAGLRGLGVFAQIGQWLIDKTATVRGLALVFVFLNFFLGMFITNDVALLTFVPFAMEVLVMSKLEKYMIPVIVLETIAANLGSMFTPLGNPQNLYLYSVYELSMTEFLKITLPYTVASLVLLVISTCILIGTEATESEIRENAPRKTALWKLRLAGYLLLFVLCMLTVLRILPFSVTLAIVVGTIACMDRKNLGKADYCLIVTFILLFVFVGNLGRIPAIGEALAALTNGNEVWTAVIASQFISNVPAAILLSGFTDRARDLIVGINIGGLGTLIASMASLISFKCYCKDKNSQAGKYIGMFSLLSVLYLAVLLGLYYVIG
ncbi:MAG: SLC13 family permease [Lachnospiraceae bacterium]|nr:SLC13 family permease [Lachnospiraceae bacterium]